jgi:MFS family permease
MSLLAIYVLSGLTGMGIGIAAPLIPLLLQQKGASGGAIGLAASIMFAAVAIAALATGRVVDRRGPKPGMVTGCVLFAAALAGMPLAPSYEWLLVVRAVEGCGIGILTVCLETAINLLVTDRNRGKAMGVYSLAFAGGVAIGPSVGVLFPGDFRLPFVVAAVISLAAGAVVVAAFRNITGGARQSDATYEGLIARTWGPLAGVLCYALIEATMLSLYPVYLASRNMEPRHIGLLFALYAGGAVVGPIIVGVISDRIRRERVMVGCGLILAIAVGGLWASQTPASMVTATAIMGVAAGAIYPTGLSIIGDRVAPARLGSGNSLYTTAYSLGSVVGPTSVGVVMDRYDARTMFVPLLTIAVAFVVLMVMDAFSRGRPRYVVARAKDAAV